MFDTPTQLEDISNQVSQQKIGDSRLRNEEIRRQMADPWSAPKPTTNTIGSQPLTDVTDNKDSTLASVYSGLLNNYNNLSSTMGSNTGSSQGDVSLPSWAGTAATTGASLLGAGPYSGLAGIATNLIGGNKQAAIKGAESWGLNTLFNKMGLGEYSGAATTLGMGLLGNKSKEDIGADLGNWGIGKALTAVNPMLGGVYGLARLFGFDPTRGAMDYSKSDIEQRFNAGYNGGFWGGGAGNRGSWNATNGSVGTNNTYSGSGYGNTAGPGSGGTGWGTGSAYTSSGNNNYSPYGGSGYSSGGSDE